MFPLQNIYKSGRDKEDSKRGGRSPEGHSAPGWCSRFPLPRKLPPGAPPPSVCSSSSTKAHLHLVDTGWGPDPSAGLGRGPTRLVAAAPTHSRRLSLGRQGWPSGPSRSGSAPAQAVPALTVSPVAHEAVSPHELLGADATLVGFETCVCLHVLGQVVLHLKLFVAHGAVKGPQVEVHVHMPISHALVGEGLPTVAQKDLIPIPTACPSRGPPSTTRHAQAPC